MPFKLRRFDPEETQLLAQVDDRMLVPVTGPTAPSPDDRLSVRRLIRAGMLRKVKTAVGEAVEIGDAASHGPWDSCGAASLQELSQVLAVSVLRAQLEALGFEFWRYRWQNRPGTHGDRTERRGVPGSVYMHAPPGMNAATVSDRVRRDYPDALACLCLASRLDPTEAAVRRALADHRALQLHYPGTLILGVQRPEAYRTLAQEINSEHWYQYPTGRLRGDLPLPLPPLVPVLLQLRVQGQAKR